jgi:DNA polymerase-3 subunit gamma/tau
VEVIVDNDLIKQEMEEIHKSITKTLQIYLHNNQLSLAIRIAERKERVKILTRREQFELLSQKNPAVEKLRQAFDLELA